MSHANRSEPLFVYGTLTFPEVLDSLLGRVPRSEPATARGYRAAALAHRSYPGLVPADGVVRGRLLVDLTPVERERLHDFEDDLYDLCPIELADGRTAVTYVWGDPGTVLDHDWGPDRFALEALHRFVDPR